MTSMDSMRRATAAVVTGIAPILLLFLIAVAGSPGARADEVAFDIAITRGQVPANMRLIKVTQGDEVKLRWTSDRLIVLHLHGYDIETRVEPGTVAEMSFTARATGRFSVEEHTPRTGGGHTHGARLVRIEVHPR